MKQTLWFVTHLLDFVTCDTGNLVIRVNVELQSCFVMGEWVVTIDAIVSYIVSLLPAVM